MVWGIVDSGADRTSLPDGYATFMGYGADDLEQARMAVANGSSTSGWSAKRPVRAAVVGLADVEFELLPLFVPGNAPPLWGRLDFFMAFNVGFEESAKHFTLTR